MNIVSLLVAAVCVLGAAALLMTRYKVQLPKRDDHEDKHGSPSSHAPAEAEKPAPKSNVHGHHDGHGHGHDDKKSGPLSFAISVLIVVATLAAAAWFLLWLYNQDAENRDRMMARRYLYFAPASAAATGTPALPPPSSIDCKGQNLAAAIIEPDESIVVRTVPGTTFWSSPDTAEGAITQCDYFNPGICSSSTERRRISTSAFLVLNSSDSPVAYYCEHR